MLTCKDGTKTTHYILPHLRDWMRHQAIDEGVTQNVLVNEAIELLKENRRLAKLLNTKKTTAVHPAKKGGKK